MCIATYAAPALAAARKTPASAVPPDTSFTIDAPASSAARATPAFVVSMLTGTPDSATGGRTTGSTRRSSSSASTGSAPGLVDSPPTSSTAAPASASASPCAIAADASRYRPPSENESGVTFTTPISARLGRSATIRRGEGGTRPRLANYLVKARRGSGPADARSEQCHDLGASRGIVLEQPAHRRGDRQRARLAHAAHRHAQVLGFDQHERAAGVQRLDERVGDLGGEPFLDLRTLGEAVDEARQLGEPGDTPVTARDVRDMGAPMECREVVFAVAEERDVAYQHHLVVVRLEGHHEVPARIFVQPAEDLRVHLGDAPRGALQAVAVGVFTDRDEDLAHGLLDARDIDGFGNVVGTAIGHRHITYPIHPAGLRIR